MNKKSLINQKNIAYILIAPVVVIFLIFMVYPVLRSLYLSFFELVSGSYEFVGLKNYAALFKDEIFYKSLFNTCIFLIVQVPVMIGGALLISCCTPERPLPNNPSPPKRPMPPVKTNQLTPHNDSSSHRTTRL